MARSRSANPPGAIRTSAELRAGRLVAGETALARATRDAMQHGDAGTVLELAHDLMAEHGARRGAPELLDVGTAQAAGTNADERAWSGRLRQFGELGSPSSSRTTARTAVS